MSENLRPPLHVAQQSRRDKLRIQQTSIQPQKDLLNVNNILYDPMIYASEMVNFLPSNTEDSSSLRSFPRSQESCDWAVGLDMDRNQNTVFVEEIASSTIYSKHNFNTIHESMNTNSTGITTHDCASKHFSEVYGNGIVVHPSMGESGWLGVGNGREFLPGYVNQASDISNNWSRSRGRMGGCDSGGWGGNKSTACDSNVVHGLSLSLSSNQWGCMNNEEQQQKPVTVCLNSLDDIVGRTSAISAHTVVAGPLGPFTGYATILKSSKFLGPTQELLEEFCDLVGCKNRKERSSDDGKGENVEEEDDDEYESSCCVATNGESVEGGGGSSSSRVGNSSSSGFCCQPEFHQKKATLLCLQEEVCRRFRQYQQQMKMVVSSFESVAGLSAATPYISQALKTVSCYFRRIKYAISDQLKHAKKALEEEMDIQAASAPAAGINGEELPPHILSPKLLHHKPKLGFPDPHHHHIWRPQRGLPERSVAILRAWLFDHFLHPYPTDTDKHMLATQTGLSRNQVSNWFINARVRVWKPMVEEIHMLETKGAVSEMGTDSRRNETKGSNRTKHTGVCNMGVAGENEYLGDTPMLETQAMVCGMEESGQQHTQDKRARVDRPLPEAMSAPLVEFSPYHHGRMEFGGIGAVSLTLGLRNNVEGVTQHQQQFLQRGHFAGQMIRDFVG